MFVVYAVLDGCGVGGLISFRGCCGFWLVW